MKCAEMPFPIQAVVRLDQQQVAPLGLLKKTSPIRALRRLTRLITLQLVRDRLSDRLLRQGFHGWPKDRLVNGKVRALRQNRGYPRIRLFVERESGAEITRPRLDAIVTEVRGGKVARGGATSWTGLVDH
jgi:hypothetical protein